MLIICYGFNVTPHIFRKYLVTISVLLHYRQTLYANLQQIFHICQTQAIYIYIYLNDAIFNYYI